MKKVLIVGAGLFGATVANILQQSGNFEVTVIDKANEIGGSCATEIICGIHVHKYGPHIFHTNNEAVWSYINQFDEFKTFYNEPLANYEGEIYHLPFNMNTFAQMFGTYTPNEAKTRIEKDKILNNNPKNLEEYALSTVGKTIYEKLIKCYTEKQWGKSCQKLPADFIKRLPLRFTYNNHYFDDKYQAVPVNGYSKMIENMLKDCEVKLLTAYTQDMNSKYDIIVYSGSIDEYFKYSEGILEYRSLEFSNSVICCENYQGVAVMNYTDHSIITRLTEHKHFLNEKSNYSILTSEIPCAWNKNKQRERYYPIASNRNKTLYNKYKSLALNIDNIYFGGRLGSYQYLNMDKVIEQAMELTIKIKNKYE